VRGDARGDGNDSFDAHPRDASRINVPRSTSETAPVRTGFSQQISAIT